MKLFATAISVPALCLCGAVTLAGYGAFEKTLRLLDVPAPGPLSSLKAAPPPFELDQVIRVMSHKHGVRPEFITSIIAAESAFDQRAVSDRGAIGLMQLMPDTARDLGVDPRVAEQNIEGGAKYFGWLLERYKHSKNGLHRAIAAYNAGPGTVDRYRGIPPFRETRNYVKRVLAFYRQAEDRSHKSWVTAARRLPGSDLAD